MHAPAATSLSILTIATYIRAHVAAFHTGIYRRRVSHFFPGTDLATTRYTPDCYTCKLVLSITGIGLYFYLKPPYPHETYFTYWYTQGLSVVGHLDIDPLVTQLIFQAPVTVCPSYPDVNYIGIYDRMGRIFPFPPLVGICVDYFHSAGSHGLISS